TERGVSGRARALSGVRAWCRGSEGGPAEAWNPDDGTLGAVRLHPDAVRGLMPTLSWEVLTVHTVVPFVIARGGYPDHRVVKVTLRDGDVVGWGEAAPNKFYGESPETAVAALERLKPLVEACDPFQLESLEAQMNAALKNNG